MAGLGYRWGKSSKRQRRDILIKLRQELGDSMFAEFMTDVLTENFFHAPISEYPMLASMWLIRKAAKIESEITDDLNVAERDEISDV